MQRFIATKLKTAQDKLLELRQRNRKRNAVVHKIPVTFGDLGSKLGYSYKIPVKVNSHKTYDEWLTLFGVFKLSPQQEKVLNAIKGNLKDNVELRYTKPSGRSYFNLLYYRMLVQEVMYFVATGVYPSPYTIAATHNSPKKFLESAYKHAPKVVRDKVTATTTEDGKGNYLFVLERVNDSKASNNK